MLAIATVPGASVHPQIPPAGRGPTDTPLSPALARPLTPDWRSSCALAFGPHHDHPLFGDVFQPALPGAVITTPPRALHPSDLPMHPGLESTADLDAFLSFLDHPHPASAPPTHLPHELSLLGQLDGLGDGLFGGPTTAGAPLQMPELDADTSRLFLGGHLPGSFFAPPSHPQHDELMLAVANAAAGAANDAGGGGALPHSSSMVSFGTHLDHGLATCGSDGLPGYATTSSADASPTLVGRVPAARRGGRAGRAAQPPPPPQEDGALAGAATGGSGGSAATSRAKRASSRHQPYATGAADAAAPDVVAERAVDGAEEEAGAGGKKRSSRFRGVTKHRRSGRWEAHIWIKEIGRQVYLGGYEDEEHAAEAYDVAALKCKGRRVKTNFGIDRYGDLLDCMDSISLEELIMAVRRQSQGFSRGSSSYRGVTAHPSGRWESRVGIPGSKHIYLGLFEDERDAARAYDKALVRLRGTGAATNFGLSEYRRELAEYHQMQQAVLLGDKRTEAIMHCGPEFEKWIKIGAQAFTFMAEALGSADDAPFDPADAPLDGFNPSATCGMDLFCGGAGAGIAGVTAFAGYPSMDCEGDDGGVLAGATAGGYGGHLAPVGEQGGFGYLGGMEVVMGDGVGGALLCPGGVWGLGGAENGAGGFAVGGAFQLSA